MKSLPRLLAISGIALLATMNAQGNANVTSQTAALKWEWPAGRKVETKLLVKVHSVEKVSKGFFGIGASPSMADALPDAHDVVSSVLSGPADLAGKTLTLRLPGIEAAKLKVGESAALGLTAGNAICICVAGAPTRDAAELKIWLDTKACP